MTINSHGRRRNQRIETDVEIVSGHLTSSFAIFDDKERLFVEILPHFHNYCLLLFASLLDGSQQRCFFPENQLVSIA